MTLDLSFRELVDVAAKGPLIIYRIGFFAVGEIPPVTRSL